LVAGVRPGAVGVSGTTGRGTGRRERVGVARRAPPARTPAGLGTRAAGTPTRDGAARSRRRIATIPICRRWRPTQSGRCHSGGVVAVAAAGHRPEQAGHLEPDVRRAHFAVARAHEPRHRRAERIDRVVDRLRGRGAGARSPRRGAHPVPGRRRVPRSCGAEPRSRPAGRCGAGRARDTWRPPGPRDRRPSSAARPAGAGAPRVRRAGDLHPVPERVGILASESGTCATRGWRRRPWCSR
jgi:hypothetical protein